MKNTFYLYLMGLWAVVLSCSSDNPTKYQREYWEEKFTEYAVEETRIRMKRDRYRMFKYPDSMNILEMKPYTVEGGNELSGEVIVKVDIKGTAKNYYGKDRIFNHTYTFVYYIPKQYNDSLNGEILKKGAFHRI